MLIGSYIAGYTTITITSKARLPAPIRMVVRDFSQMTIGPEVVEETDTTIILKDLLNPAEMPLKIPSNGCLSSSRTCTLMQ